MPVRSQGSAAPSGAAAQPRGSAARASPVRTRGARTRPAPAVTQGRPGDTIQAIRIEGNQRIEPGTIQSYMLLAPGDPFDPDRIDRSLKTLYATGLFSDVSLRREGSTLVVHVAENPLVNRVAFEGNSHLTDEQLRAEVQLRPRAVFTTAQAQGDRQRLLDLYAHHARFAAKVDPKIIRLPENRVDVVFAINEGPPTLISRIAFVGNHAFGEGRLREVVNSRQSVWWRFLSTSDNYDPEHINFDKELLRRFYLRNGYADFEVQDATAELSPDRRSFFVTFLLHEGERYRVGKVSVDSKLPRLDGAVLLPDVQLGAGDTYDGDAVERSVTAIQDDVQNRGYAFVDVRPRIARDQAKHTVDLVFDVTEGPRVYVERIDIVGNTRTEDKVIRREFRLAEGDAFNAAAIRRSRQRLQDLGYFNNVNITSAPGSTPDRAVVTTTVQEKSTGELTVGGGYSTDAGALLNLGLRERNFIGTGVDAGINGTLGTKESQVDLSATDPYFLDRNLVAGFDIFDIVNNNQDISDYSEKRYGFTVNLGYEFNDHLRQSWNYSLVDRDVYDIASTASIYVQNQSGYSLLSQIGQTITLDYRDSRVDPHKGLVLRLGSDFAGIGGDAHFVRTKVDASYFIPLTYFTNDTDWGVVLSAGAGYLFQLGHVERIIDRFFLGGDNLRGFEAGGAGPHDTSTGDSLGGRFIWTQSTELHFPLPISPDLGLSGRAFVDVGALSQVNSYQGNPIIDDASPRVGAGVGVAWRTPFGLINIDVADPVVKKHYDKTQIFRFGFGTRF
ncbi:MAG: outer membrane protein assembly factor BamA [Acidisphaera sp.]|nr:outer membrane protein assembly factor BamA [Acidisphaera sp.]